MKKTLILILLIISKYIFSDSNDYLINFYEKGIENNKLQSFYKAVELHNNAYAITFLEFKNDDIKNKKSYDVKINNNKLEYEKYKQINVNGVDINGYTPIMIATIYNNLEIFKVLVEKGANIDVLNPVSGKTILNTAIFYGADDVAEYIIKKYRKYVNIGANTDGWLPIQDAVLKENEKILLLLLKNGAIIRKKDNNGNDAYDIATRHGKGKMVKILRDYEMKK